jgi:Tfp pilus assembly protein PilN
MRLDQTFPIASSDLAADFSFMDDVSGEGRLASAAAVSVDQIRSAIESLKSAGFKAEKIVPAALGGLAFAQSRGMSDAMVVSHDGEAVSIDVVAGGHLVYSRSAIGPQSASFIEAEIARTAAASGSLEPTIVTAGGLELAGVDQVNNQTTLEELSHSSASDLILELPEHREAAAQAVNRRWGLYSIFAFAAAACVISFVWDDYDKANNKVELTTKAYRGTKTARTKELRSIEAELDKAGAASKALQTVFEPAQTPLDAVIVAGNSAPKSVWLTGITAERGRPLQIRGTSKTSQDAATFVEQLGANERLRDVNLVFTNNANIDETPVVQFSVTAHVIGNLPLIEKKQTGRRRRS